MENTKKKQKKVYVLCGPAGSGKSTFAHKLMHPVIDVMISRDLLRFGMLKEGEDYFAHEHAVRNKFFQNITHYTTNSTYEGVFIDATHLTPKSRRQTNNHIHNNSYKIAISIEVPLAVALERNAQREGRALVPDSAIINMYNIYKIPTLEEGFNEIWHVDAEGVITKEVR